MTEGAIAAVSLQSAAAQLQDKIRVGFVELIPPEQWRAMIEKELTDFTQPRQRPPHSYDPRPGKSVFSEICEQEFRAFVTKKAREVLDADNAEVNHWNGRVGELVKEWLTENREKLIQSTILALAGNAAQGLLAAMAESGRNNG